ncbi:MAG TPA: MOSC N-terminal beta barrel domain-containing protein [Steroidobacteraceae bacterium]|jgi:hypothetical protein
MATITALNIYPVKSCRGIALERARIAATGFDHDREWLIVDGNGRFVTQREEPRLALIVTAISNTDLILTAPGNGTLAVPLDLAENPVEVTCWRDRCAAFDAGDEAAQWIERFLGAPHRLVRFNRERPRASDAAWTREVQALNQFSDAFPWLIIGAASLRDLNTRLAVQLPMNRFRPNIVIDGLPAYGEDEVHEFQGGNVRLRIVKGCTRCAITTTDQETGERATDEPLRTLSKYRLDRQLKGVIFGQNAILLEGVGKELSVGQELAVTHALGSA